MATIALSGTHIGTIVSMTFSGILANKFGWESCFYVFGMQMYNLFTICVRCLTQHFLCVLGAIGCIWYIFWVIIVRSGPEDDKYITKDELRYIQESLGASQNSSHSSIKHPWKEIFTSKPVYAIIASHFAENWGFYTMLTQLPSFLAGMIFDLF